jgi:hypothetical protein
MGLTTKYILPVGQHPHAFDIRLSRAIQTKAGFGAGWKRADAIPPKIFLQNRSCPSRSVPKEPVSPRIS